MPVYEYKCSSCQRVFDKQFSIVSVPSETWCAYCELPAQLLISLSTFVLKGGGWYKDGYNK